MEASLGTDSPKARQEQSDTGGGHDGRIQDAEGDMDGLGSIDRCNSATISASVQGTRFAAVDETDIYSQRLARSLMNPMMLERYKMVAK